MLEDPGGITKANAHLFLLGLFIMPGGGAGNPQSDTLGEREESGDSKVTRKIWGEEPHGNEWP